MPLRRFLRQFAFDRLKPSLQLVRTPVRTLGHDSQDDGRGQDLGPVVTTAKGIAAVRCSTLELGIGAWKLLGTRSEGDNSAIGGSKLHS